MGVARGVQRTTDTSDVAFPPFLSAAPPTGEQLTPSSLHRRQSISLPVCNECYSLTVLLARL